MYVAIQKPEKGAKYGFNRKSEKATRKDLWRAVPLMKLLESEELEKQAGKYNLKLWSLADCMCANRPKALFVVRKELLDANQKNAGFPSQVILNPRIVKAEDEIKYVKPERKTVWDEVTEKRTVQDVLTTYKISNKIKVDEGHPAYLRYKPRKVERYHSITVQYWYPYTIPYLNWTVLLPKREKVEGFKAFLFQFEIDNINANSHYAKKNL